MSDAGGERSLAYLSTIPVSRVKLLTGKRASSLNAAGIESVTDLLFHVPRRYIDRSTTAAINDVPLGEEVTVVGTVQTIKMRHVRKNLAIINAVVTDGETFLFVTWFNQKFRVRQLAEGTQVALSGKIERKKGRLEMKSPEADVLDRPGESLVTGRVVPVHPGVKGVGPGYLRRGIHNAVKRSLPVSDPIPAEMRERLSLMDRSAALQSIHFPESLDEVVPARDRLVFDELFRLEVALALQKRRQIDEAVGIAHVRASDGLMAELVKGLPFPLTTAQQRVIDEVQTDMARPHPMHRLLLGDVGSGKTVVAVAAMLTAVDGGHQGAVMAPTEVLAVQHFLSIGGLLAGAGMAPPLEALGMSDLFTQTDFDRPVRIALLTGSNAEVNYRESITRSELLAEIADGAVDIVIGTHALIQEGVHFHHLGVAVVDEQHRFGVHQRVELREKGAEAEPDLLIMTATPIPRTLSMTLYGDLDVSSIGRDEMPPGRPEVETVALAKTPAAEEQWLERVRDQAAAGHQTFVVCPLVEDSLKIEAASATAEHKRLSGLLPDLRVGLLHGQMVPADKAAVMAAFRDRQLDVLVATTVIEVGIDIPHSTVMVIEDADRFGLSQLHQLRGRLSRGVGPNYCYLVAEPTTTESEERLAAMVASDDGFVLAEEDLRIRGTGTVFGARQAGAADLRISDIMRDTQLLVDARREAFAMVAADPGLVDHQAVSAEVQALLGDAVAWLFVS
ncbi:MAG: ATP-dependent DNA helicase RecG [Acidimicrobiia bacterium]|nr:ATP-dependent DNA helicase RecG [Acidimicrobiia bacterium]MBT8194152.1 ATP-dependent DNA helicase RecG [Acidimicrobiia bacterium]MBT8247638.1 ATP-dependent DNA helicase RecG [Acidimicrobiia bacterium]NNJ48458.1 ATP-dependent DNA helicase RecG [Acidimicrobiia bacterium]NNL13203.1 ATP-dependent DNA helicase RecG [Acidimicrobiia bacterium]